MIRLIFSMENPLLVEGRDWKFRMLEASDQQIQDPKSHVWSWFEHGGKATKRNIFWDTQGSPMFGYFQLAGQSQKQSGIL